MPGNRSLQAIVWRRLYKRARWRRIRNSVLAVEPLCQRCKEQGLIIPATEVHHNPPHQGDIERFWSGPFEALCKPCHDGPVKRAELTGIAVYDATVGADGWPIDPLHPANGGRGIPPRRP